MTQSHLMSMAGSLSIVEFLLGYGAKVIKDFKRGTPEMLASPQTGMATLMIFRNMGASPKLLEGFKL